MQKIIRATARIKTQAKRRLKGKEAETHSTNRQSYDEQCTDRVQLDRSHVVAAKVARREDWKLGPLAPRRDVGDSKDIYGTISVQQLTRPEKPRGWKNWCIREGDRVVIVGSKQRDRGKIGVVREVRQAAEECFIRDLNMV